MPWEHEPQASVSTALSSCPKLSRVFVSKLIVCGVYYLTVLVYTKTTIHLSVGG